MRRLVVLLTLVMLCAALTPSAAPASPLTWTRATSAIDVHQDANAMSCPTATLCVVAEEDGRLAVSTNPAAATPAWATFDMPVSLMDGVTPSWFTAVACPAADDCIATTRSGDLFVSSDPANQASWTKSLFAAGVHYGRTVDRLSCQAGHPCVGYDEANSEVVITSAPAGGAGGWHADTFDYSLADVSCMAGPVCVGTSGSSITHTTNPGGGADKWSVVNNVGNLFDGLASRDNLDSVWCGGTFCIAGGHGTAGHNGGLYWSTNPLGDASAWSSFPSFFSEVSRLSCSPGGNRCVAWRDSGSFIFDATNPLGGKSAWTLTNPAVNGDYVADVSCPEVSICFAISLSGYFSVGKDGFTGGTGDPIPTPPPSTTTPPPAKPAPKPIPIDFPAPTFGKTPTQLDLGGVTMSTIIRSASDAQATVRMLSNQPIVEISAKQKKKRVQTFGSVKVALKANVATKVKIKLTKAAQRYFRRHATVKVKIVVSATTTAGVTKTSSKAVTIKRRTTKKA